MLKKILLESGFSPGILSVRRETSKSRKFGILNYERLADKCEPSLGNESLAEYPATAGCNEKNIHCPGGDLNHQPSDS